MVATINPNLNVPLSNLKNQKINTKKKLNYLQYKVLNIKLLH